MVPVSRQQCLEWKPAKRAQFPNPEYYAISYEIDVLIEHKRVSELVLDTRDYIGLPTENAPHLNVLRLGRELAHARPSALPLWPALGSSRMA